LTIYYISPDLSRPSGGVRTIYRHVDALNDCGFDAAVLHTKRGFRCEWFANTTKLVYPPIELTSSDLLVVPEQYTTSQFNRLAPESPRSSATRTPTARSRRARSRRRGSSLPIRPHRM